MLGLHQPPIVYYQELFEFADVEPLDKKVQLKDIYGFCYMLEVGEGVVLEPIPLR